MENLTRFLEENKTALAMDFGAMSIITHYKGIHQIPMFDYEFSGILYCQKVHFEGLLSLGVKIDFSDIRVGFQNNQNSCGGSGNTNAVRVQFNFETYKRIEKFFRKEGSLNMLNNHHLMKLGFPFTKRCHFSQESILSESQYLRIKKIRRMFYEKTLSDRSRNCYYVQKNL
jgi:hypothetical protein